MTTKVFLTEKIAYTVGYRVVTLDKELADRYSEIVCPIDETILTVAILAFGRDCDDKVMSARIQADMADEIKEYGYTLTEEASL